jgi:voltage-gated potassium channel
MDERSERVERFFEWPVLAAAVLVLPVIVIEQTAVSETVKTIAGVLNWAIWITFAAELVAMLWVVPEKWRWLARNPLDVMIVVLTPPVLPPALQSLRVLRLLRLLRLLKLAQVSRRVFSLQGLRYAALVALLTIIGGGAAFVAAEKSQQDLDLWDGVWWAVSTMTTVGSNIQPLTTLGRVIAMALMVVGIAFVALLTGAVAERFLGPEIKEEIKDVRGEIGETEAAIDAEEGRLLDEFRSISQRMNALEAELKRLMARS